MKSLPTALAAALLVATVAVAAPASKPEPAVEYKVAPRDTLYDLAERYFVRRDDYRTVQRLNRIADPRRLPTGRSLRIPPELLRTEPVVGRLAAFRGEVLVSGAPAQVGMPIREGHALATGPNAFLTVVLPDDSRIALPSNSRVRVTRLRRVLLTGAVERAFAVDQGRSRSVVTPATNPRDRFNVSTPLTVAAVRGTEFRVNHSPDQGRSAVEVVEGKVGAQGAAGGEALIQAGFGAQADASALSPPRPLLASPEVIRSMLLQDEPELAFGLQPSSGATAYRVQIANDGGFVDIVAEATAPEPRLALDSVPNGTYFARFTALDAAGLEGLPADFAFERRLNSLRLDEPAPVGGARRQYQFRWLGAGEGAVSYRFRLQREGAPHALIDEAGLASESIVITDLTPGVYQWQVLAAREANGRRLEKWSPMQRFEIAQ